MDKKNIFKNIFGSELKVKILGLFLQNPQTRFYQKEIAFKIGAKKINAVQYELKKLEEIGFLKSFTTSYYKFYFLNYNFLFYKDLSSIFQNINFGFLD